MTKLVRVLKKYHKYKPDDCIFDAGSGTGVSLWRLALELGCRGFGIEYSKPRMFMAHHYTKQLLQQQGKKPGFNRNVLNMYGDLQHLNRLPENVVTLFLFDEAFWDTLMSHIVNNFISSGPSTLRYIITSKQTKFPQYKELFRSAGLEFKEAIKLTKCGSGESSTFILYERTQTMNMYPTPNTSTKSIEVAYEAYFAGGNSVKEQIDIYQRMQYEVEQMMDEETKARKISATKKTATAPHVENRRSELLTTRSSREARKDQQPRRLQRLPM